MMVVFHHAPRHTLDVLHETNFGARGVEIFFVISGFIMPHTTRALTAGRWQQVWGFLEKRLIRVVPLYWIVLSYMALPMLINRGPNLDLLKDYFFIPHYSQRYPGEIYPLLVPGWSLNYEMIFYLLFGVAILCRRYRLHVVLLVLTAAWLAGLIITPRSAPAVFYTSADILLFGVGVLVYAVYDRAPTAKWSVTYAAAVTLISFAILGFDGGGLRVLAYGAAAATIVYATATCFGQLHLRGLNTLGDASYSIYLFHAPALPLSAWLARSLDLGGSSSIDALAVVFLYLAVGAAVGVAAHFLLERPVLSFLNQHIGRPATPVLARPD